MNKYAKVFGIVENIACIDGDNWSLMLVEPSGRPAPAFIELEVKVWRNGREAGLVYWTGDELLADGSRYWLDGQPGHEEQTFAGLDDAVREILKERGLL